MQSQYLSSYYSYLLSHPVPFVPYSVQSLSYLRDYCASNIMSPAAVLAAMELSGPLSSVGWDSVQPGPFTFPADHGPHWNIRNEWYYLACNCMTDKQEPVSILLAIIRRGTIPEAIAKQTNLYRDSNNSNLTAAQFQVVACEASVELPNNTYLTSTDAFDGLDPNTLITMTNDPFQWFVLGNTKMYGLSAIPGSNAINCGVVTDKFQIQLQLTAGDGSNNPPLFFLQGDKGCAPCLDGIGYRYYSWPDLKVTGTVSTLGATPTTYNLTGQGWLDHQWGSRMQPFGYVDNLYVRALALLSGNYPKTLMPQWNWFFMHLDNGMHITTAVLPSLGINSPSAVQLTNTSLIQRSYDGTVLDVVTFQGNGTVVSSSWINVNCILFPSEWDIHIIRQDDTASPLVIDLQLSGQQPMPAGVSQGVDNLTFMEKGVVVNGTVNDKPVKGVGFAEAIGYDTMTNQIIQLLQTMGVKEYQDVLSFFYPAGPTTEQLALAGLLVVGPPVLLLIVIVVVVTVVVVKKKKRKALL